MLVACFRVVTPFELHCRLGHPSFFLLKKLYPQFSSLSSLNCESCQYAKLHCVHLSPIVNKRASSHFELVHSDVWGPCPVVSPIGFWYFAMFVNDYSRTTWLYLIKNYTELFSHFYALCDEIHTQFHIYVQNLRSDNAKEYMSKQFQSFMLQNDILCDNPNPAPGVKRGCHFFFPFFPVYYKLINFKLVHSYNVKHLTCTIFYSSGLQNIFKLH